MKLYFFCVLLIVSLSLSSQAQCDREQVINDYNNIYLQTAVSTEELAWTGSVSTCMAGTISTLAQTKTLARINYYRNLAGLGPIPSFDETLNSKCQQAALMMSANNTISHFPPDTWQCYTSDGAQAAQYSNLVLGAHSSAAIDLFMNDFGTNFAGHRRLILNSRPPAFGHGSTSNSDALWLVGLSGTAGENPVTFPSEGFFPAPLVPSSGYWSFGLGTADFSSATIEMKDQEGATVPLTVMPLVTGYGDNTIVWQPTGIVTDSPYDIKYSVTVSHVGVSGSFNDYSYDVIICQPVHPPECPPGQSWSDAVCECSVATGINDNFITDTYIVANNPFSGFLRTRIRIPETGEYKLSILDMNGRKMDEKKIWIMNDHESTFTWDTASWKNGMYFIILEDPEGKRITLKVIK